LRLGPSAPPRLVMRISRMKITQDLGGPPDLMSVIWHYYFC